MVGDKHSVGGRHKADQPSKRKKISDTDSAVFIQYITQYLVVLNRTFTCTTLLPIN